MQLADIKDFIARSGHPEKYRLFARTFSASLELGQQLKHEMQSKSWLTLSRLATRRMIAERDFPVFGWRRFTAGLPHDFLNEISEMGLCFSVHGQKGGQDSIGARLGLDELLLESVRDQISFRRRLDGEDLLPANNQELFAQSENAQTLIFCVRTKDQFFAGCQLSLSEAAGILGCERILLQGRLLRLDSEENRERGMQNLSDLAQECRFVIASLARTRLDYATFESQLSEIFQRGFSIIDLFESSGVRSQARFLGSAYQGLSTRDLQQAFERPDYSELQQALKSRDAALESAIQAFVGDFSFEEIGTMPLGDVCALMHEYAAKNQSRAALSQNISSIKAHLKSLALAHLQFSQPLDTLSSSERLRFRMLEFFLAGINESLLILDSQRSSIDPLELVQLADLLRTELPELSGILLLGVGQNENLQANSGAGSAILPSAPGSQEFFEVRGGKAAPILSEFGQFVSKFICLTGAASSGKSFILRKISQELAELFPEMAVVSNMTEPEWSSRSFGHASQILDLLIDQILRLEQVRKLGLQKSDFKSRLLCGACRGKGYELLDSETLSVPIECSHCHGKLFLQELQNLNLGEHSFARILCSSPHEIVQMSGVGQKTREALHILIELGLGHIALQMPVKYMNPAERVDLRTFQIIFSRGRQLNSRRASKAVVLLDDPLLGRKLESQGKLEQQFKQLAAGQDTVFCTDSTGQLRDICQGQYSLTLTRQPEVVVRVAKL